MYYASHKAEAYGCTSGSPKQTTWQRLISPFTLRYDAAHFLPVVLHNSELLQQYEIYAKDTPVSKAKCIGGASNSNTITVSKTGGRKDHTRQHWFNTETRKCSSFDWLMREGRLYTIFSIHDGAESINS